MGRGGHGVDRHFGIAILQLADRSADLQGSPTLRAAVGRAHRRTALDIRRQSVRNRRRMYDR
jgi:hypothetical protein